MSDIVDRARNRIHDAPMETERLIDDLTAEIDRLQKEIAHLTELIRQNMPHILDKGRRG